LDAAHGFEPWGGWSPAQSLLQRRHPPAHHPDGQPRRKRGTWRRRV